MPIPSAEVHSQVGRVLSAYAHAIDDGDVDAVLNLMSEDAVVSYDGGTYVRTGHAEIRAFLAQALVGASTHLISNLLVEQDKDVVHAKASAIVCITREPGTVKVRGVSYDARMIQRSDAWAITSLNHKSTWQFSVPAAPCDQ